jgi:hypothetical protein
MNFNQFVILKHLNSSITIYLHLLIMTDRLKKQEEKSKFHYNKLGQIFLDLLGAEILVQSYNKKIFCMFAYTYCIDIFKIIIIIIIYITGF